MKLISFVGAFILIQASGFAKGAKGDSIVPTGTYKLKTETYIIGGNIYGYRGQVDVLQTDSTKVFLLLDVNKGAPTYNTAIIKESLSYSYKKGQAIYTVSDIGETCRLIFIFTEDKLTIKAHTDNYIYCGLGYDVEVDHVYEKVSSKKPIFIDPFTGKELK